MAATDHLSDGDAEAIREGVLQACLHGADQDQLDTPEHALRMVAATDAAVRHGSALRADAVTSARHCGHSWAAIGSVLGISRQAAQQRFGAAATTTPDEAARQQRVIRRVTALSEMAVLDREQAEGWHLVGFGVGKLVVAASDHPWEHERLTFASHSLLRAMEQDGWQIVGTWGWWTYMKRPVAVPPG
jgi:hypothetical protein